MECKEFRGNCRDIRFSGSAGSQMGVWWHQTCFRLHIFLRCRSLSWEPPTGYPNQYRGNGYANRYQNNDLINRISAVSKKHNNTGFLTNSVYAWYASTWHRRVNSRGCPTETGQQIPYPNSWKGSNIWSNIHKVDSTPRHTDSDSESRSSVQSVQFRCLRDTFCES
jgi:hypothetical protein